MSNHKKLSQKKILSNSMPEYKRNSKSISQRKPARESLVPVEDQGVKEHVKVEVSTAEGRSKVSWGWS